MVVRRFLKRRTRVIPDFLGTAPWWVGAVVGGAATVFGTPLIFRPLSSLTTLGMYVGMSFIVSGITDLLSAARSHAPKITFVLSAMWIAVGGAILIWDGLTFEVLAGVVAAALLLSGVIRCVLSIRRGSDERIAGILFGLSDIALGAMAAQWPDVTLLVIAVLFGIRTVLFGLTAVGVAIRRRPGHSTLGEGTWAPRTRATFQRWFRSIAVVVALTLAVGIGVVGGQLQADTHSVSTFYTADERLPDEPGLLLKSEPFTRGIPDSAKAWRILYSTTRHDGTPALASGIVLVAADAPSGPRPVVAWAHGTTGTKPNCAPSELADPFGAGALPALGTILEEKWILVATDYTGLGTAGPHPYLIGQGEARSVLDAVRAARSLDTVEMADETIVWGHSQGGHAALWTGQIAKDYAPELELAGVAAMAPASDIVTLSGSLPGVMGASVFGAYIIAAYTQNYPDIDFRYYVTPTARTLVREMAERCLTEPGVVVSVISGMSIAEDFSVFAADPTKGTFGARLRENTPTGHIDAPLFIGQGLADTLVDPGMQEDYVAERCAAGQELEFHTYPDQDHLQVVRPGSAAVADLVAWTKARIAHEPAQSTCT